MNIIFFGDGLCEGIPGVFFLVTVYSVVILALFKAGIHSVRRLTDLSNVGFRLSRYIGTGMTRLLTLLLRKSEKDILPLLIRKSL